jgi:hypothetical protein
MSETDDRRAHPRVSVDAVVRLRESGTGDSGIPCRISDASQGGVAVVTEERPQSDFIWVEILTSSGHQVGDPLQAHVLRVDPRPEGGYHVACMFEPPAD